MANVLTGETRKVFEEFVFRLAQDMSADDYGEDQEELYREVASEMASLFFFQDECEFPSWVRDKVDELAPKFRLTKEEKE